MFRDRREAGRAVAAELAEYAHRPDAIVLALPRGGVPVGYEVAHALGLPLDVFLVRKLGVPGQEELALGAVASGGMRVLNEHIKHALHLSDRVIDEITREALLELQRREQAYRDGRPLPDLAGRTVILVDDGLATGATMRAAIATVKQAHPAEVVVAVPVAAEATCLDLQREVDRMICVHAPEMFFAVGAWYEDFSQTTDDEVRDLLNRAYIEHSERTAARVSAGESSK